MSTFRLSQEDRTFLAHYSSLTGEDAKVFAAANADRLAATYARVNAVGADSSEWTRPRKVVAITVLRCAPRGMSPAPPLSKKDAALLDTYAGLSGAEAIEFYERHRDALITASLNAAHAADDGSNAAAPGQFPPLPPQTPTATTATPQLAGTIQLRLSLATESSGPAVVLDLDYGVGAPVRALTVPISAIVPGWQQGLLLNLIQPQTRIAAKGEQAQTPLPPRSTSLPSKLRRIFKSKP